MSSGPSHECRYGNPSGTILFNIISISSLQDYNRYSHIEGAQKKRLAELQNIPLMCIVFNAFCYLPNVGIPTLI
jgi:hypothetical protein